MLDRELKDGGVAGACGHLFLEISLSGEVFPAEFAERLVVERLVGDLPEPSETDDALDMVPPVARLPDRLVENCDTGCLTGS